MKTKGGRIVEATVEELRTQYDLGGWARMLGFRAYLALLRYEGVRVKG